MNDAIAWLLMGYVFVGILQLIAVWYAMEISIGTDKITWYDAFYILFCWPVVWFFALQERNLIQDLRFEFGLFFRIVIVMLSIIVIMGAVSLIIK